MKLLLKRTGSALRIVVLTSLSVAGCTLIPFGDYGETVFLHNRTDVLVYVYELAADGSQGTPARQVAPGETLRNQWLTPRPESRSPTGTRTVEAKDEAGNVVFCRTYTYAELERGGWNIDIRRDTQGCKR